MEKNEVKKSYVTKDASAYCFRLPEYFNVKGEGNNLFPFYTNVILIVLFLSLKASTNQFVLANNNWIEREMIDF
jgi:hypothetical protein